MVYSILVFLLFLISVLLIVIILLQSGQGDMGAAMGGNTMNQAFGSQGADKLLVRITTGLAVIFMVLAIFIQREQVAEADLRETPSMQGKSNQPENNNSNSNSDATNTSNEASGS